MLDFSIKQIGKTFNSNKNYDNKINGADIMIMQSEQDADILIKKLKEIIDSDDNILFLDYDDSHLLTLDKIKVKNKIKQYYMQKHKS